VEHPIYLGVTMDRSKIPPIINCRTISQKDNRSLVWLHAGIPKAKASVYTGIATSLADYLEWKDTMPIVALLLLSISSEDFAVLKKHKIPLFVTKAVFEQFPRDQWIALQVSIGILEELIHQFPIIGSPWNGSPIDAVACATLMFHFNNLIVTQKETVSAQRQEQFATLGIQIADTYPIPPQIWLITQYFIHSVTKRQKEIRECLKNNMANPLIDKVVLLNEEDLRYEWSSSKYASKVHQELIRKRLTYADLLKYTYESVPSNTIVIYANADIFCNDTLKHLYQVHMKDKLFALLRYDEQESGALQLFGPRADSQDTWICLSDSIKSRTWDWKLFDYRLGTAGCDNRFTGDMFGMRFLISNPCQTLQTIHVHRTAIRNYNPRDIVQAKLYMYIHPCSLVEIEQKATGEDKLFSLSSRLTTVAIKGLSAKKTQTYCVMLARENRFKWSDIAPTTTTLKPLAIHRFKDAFVTNSGVVYDYKNVYLGSVESSNDFVQKVGRDLGISFVAPAERTDSMLAIPCTTVNRFTNVDLYCLYYLSYALQIYSQLPATEVSINPSLYVHPTSISTLQTFKMPNAKDGKVNAISWSPTAVVYAPSVYGFIPEVCEITTTEIEALRSAFPMWQPLGTNKCVVLVDELLHPSFITDSIQPLLPADWSVQQVLRTSCGIDAYIQLVGAGLCILYNLPKQEEQWAKLWALPKGCITLEFQNELKVEGGFQHLAAAASLDAYCIPLHKGTSVEMREQLLAQFQLWLKEHPLRVATEKPTNQVITSAPPESHLPTNQVFASPTGMFLSL